MGLIVCPSRELARQTHEVIMGYIQSLKQDGFPELRLLLAMGGIDMREQVRAHCAGSLLCEEGDHTPSFWSLHACLPRNSGSREMRGVVLCDHHKHVLLNAMHMAVATCDAADRCR